MNEEEDVLVIGDDDYEHHELSEHEDYIIVEDPEGDEDSWCLLFVKGPYKDWVIRFDDVALNAKTSDLTFTYHILNVSDKEIEYEETEFVNYLSSALLQVITDLHRSGAQRYQDLETGEEVTEL